MEPTEREKIYLGVRDHLFDSLCLLDKIRLSKDNPEELSMFVEVYDTIEKAFLLLLPEAE